MQLKRSQPLTARQLGARLGTSLNAVRHHLKELEAEALVGYAREHRGVGAPVFVYRLSAAGEGLFPRRYEQTLTHLLDHIVAREGRAAAVTMLEAHFQSLGERLRVETADWSAVDRLHALASALSAEGYMAEAEAEGNGGTLTGHNCAIRAVAERFPEVCEAETRLVADVVGGVVERRSHILAGCGTCQYTVRFAAAESSAPPHAKETL